MPAHAEGHTFYQVRTLVFDAPFPDTFDGIINSQHIIAINHHAFHSITLSAVSKLGAAELFIHRGTQSVTIILNNEDHGQVPYRSHIQCFMKISLAGTTITCKSK